MTAWISAAAPYLIIFPLVFAAGIVDAIAGGGGLISLPAYMIAGLPVHNAIATNKLSSSMGTSVATARLAKAGYIPWKKALVCIASALVGSFLGARLALIVSDRIFKWILLVILPLTAFYILRRKPLDETDHPRFQQDGGRTSALTVLIALVIGVYDGFYGPGTGTFLLILFTSVAGLQLGEANGMTKAINLTTNLTALTIFLISGKVLIPLGLAAGCCNIAGNYIGITFFKSKGSRAVTPIMLIVLTIFFLKILLEMFGVSLS